MNKHKSKRIYRDKHGREYQKERYFVGGKMKFHRVYVIDGIPADEFYRRNVTEIEMVINGDFHLIDEKKHRDNYQDESISFDKKDVEDLPF